MFAPSEGVPKALALRVMNRQIIAAVLMCISANAAATAPTNHAKVVPEKVLIFKDWAVGCDNGLACQAVGLLPEGLPEGSLSIVVARAEGVNGALSVEMSGFASKSDRYRIVIDGKIANKGSVPVGGEIVTITGADAMNLMRALAKGRMLRLIDGAGVLLGSASLSGASAAFRYADSAQGRAGSRGAIIATGSKIAAAKKSVLPVITAQKIKPTNNLPDAGALVALSESSPCAAERFGPTEDSTYSLGVGTIGPEALVLLNCGSGAYNFSSGIYTGQRDAKGKWNFEPAKFDYGAAGFSIDSKIPVLINAGWDTATQSISSYAKGRGIGDCGSSENFVWDGDMFRLTGAAVMEECRGSVDWIPVWRAEIRLID